MISAELRPELCRYRCHDNIDCIYLRMKNWLTCSENYDWRLAHDRQVQLRLDTEEVLRAHVEALSVANERISSLQKRVRRIRRKSRKARR